MAKKREDEKYTDEELPDLETIVKEFFETQKGADRNGRHLFRKINKKLGDQALVADQVELLSKKMCRRKMFNEAHEFTSRACEDVVNTKMLHEASRVCMVMQEYDEALDYLALCGKLEKDKNAETYSDIARCMYKLGNREQSRTVGMNMVTKALAIDANCANAWLNKGNIHADIEEPAEARRCYEKAKSIKPRLAGAFTNLGNLLYFEGRYEDACFEYLAALDIDPDDSDTLGNLGLALGYTIYKDYATIAFEEAASHGGNEEVMINYLYTLLEQQEFDKFTKTMKVAKNILDEEIFAEIKATSAEFLTACREAGELKDSTKLSATAEAPLISISNMSSTASTSASSLAAPLTRKASEKGGVASLLSSVLKRRATNRAEKDTLQ